MIPQLKKKRKFFFFSFQSLNGEGEGAGHAGASPPAASPRTAPAPPPPPAPVVAKRTERARAEGPKALPLCGRRQGGGVASCRAAAGPAGPPGAWPGHHFCSDHCWAAGPVKSWRWLPGGGPDPGRAAGAGRARLSLWGDCPVLATHFPAANVRGDPNEA